MTAIDFTRPGPWRELWPQALGLMSHLETVTFKQFAAPSFKKSFWECAALAHVILDPLVR